MDVDELGEIKNPPTDTNPQRIERTMLRELLLAYHPHLAANSDRQSCGRVTVTCVDVWCAECARIRSAISLFMRWAKHSDARRKEIR